MNVCPFLRRKLTSHVCCFVSSSRVSFHNCLVILHQEEGKQAFRHNVSISQNSVRDKFSLFFSKQANKRLNTEKKIFFSTLNHDLDRDSGKNGLTTSVGIWVHINFFFSSPSLVSREKHPQSQLFAHVFSPFYPLSSIPWTQSQNKNKWKPILLLSEDAFGVKINFMIEFFFLSTPLLSQFVTDIRWDFTELFSRKYLSLEKNFHFILIPTQTLLRFLWYGRNRSYFEEGHLKLAAREVSEKSHRSNLEKMLLKKR